MSEDRKYVRVYYNDLIRDYPEVWADDALLATWLRMLATADPMWPTPPELPRSVRSRPLAGLIRASLVEVLPTHRFRMKGMDAERTKRADAARNAAASRWQSGSNADGNAKAMPKRAEQSKAETSQAEHIPREGLPNLDTEAIRALEERTGRTWGQAGERQLSEYDRLIEDHGLEAVCGAMDALREGKPMTARQLVWGAMKVLEPMLSPRIAADAEHAEEVERNSRRGVDATQRYLQKLRAVAERRPV